MTAPFGRYAKYYNLLYRDKDYSAEADYIEGLIKKHVPGAKSILDLGCGTGRHDLLLAEKGFSIMGVDLSEEMLSAANSQLQGRSTLRDVNFLCGNIQSVRIGRTFDVVLSLFHVMSYQITNQMLQDSIANAYSHLKEGGIFIFDFWYGPAVLTDRPTNRVKRLEDNEISINRTATPVLHLNDNIVDVIYEVLIEDKKTRTVDTLKETHRMRYFFLPELSFVLEVTGFSIVTDLAWMQGDKRLGPDSWYGLLIARK